MYLLLVLQMCSIALCSRVKEVIFLKTIEAAAIQDQSLLQSLMVNRCLVFSYDTNTWYLVTFLSLSGSFSL